MSPRKRKAQKVNQCPKCGYQVEEESLAIDCFTGHLMVDCSACEAVYFLDGNHVIKMTMRKKSLYRDVLEETDDERDKIQTS